MNCLWMAAISKKTTPCNAHLLQLQPEACRTPQCSDTLIFSTQTSIFGKQTADSYSGYQLMYIIYQYYWPKSYTQYMHLYTWILEDNAMLKHLQKGSTSTSSVDILIPYSKCSGASYYLGMTWSIIIAARLFLPTHLFPAGWLWAVYGAKPKPTHHANVCWPNP